jgi:hypothetical protein
MPTLQERATEIAGLFQARSRAMFISSVFIKVVLITVGSLVAAVAQLVTQPKGWDFAGIGGALIAALGGAALAFTEKDSSKELEVARSAIESARDLQREADKVSLITADLKRAFELYSAMKTMRERLSNNTHQCPIVRYKISSTIITSSRSVRF